MPGADHVEVPGEPLLWLADVPAGAIVADRCGDPGYFKRLAGATEIHYIGR